jgi:outer membrane protein OmpA-like peptidoglycan-associated protein
MIKPHSFYAVLALLSVAFPVASVAQEVESDVSVLSKEISGRLDGFSYQEGPESELDFRGTPIALGARGEAEVEFQQGRARVDVEVEKLPPPESLGPFATYVLWAVTADGSGSNLGSIEVKDGHGELEATTPLAQFALIISAEPHYAVTSPSRAIVLQNLAKRVRGKKFTIADLKERIDYTSLSPQNRDQSGKIPPDLIQARYALAIADGAEAERLVPADYAKAEALLNSAEAAQKDKKSSVRKTVPLLARDAVQSFEDARLRAVTALAAEKNAAATRSARESAESQAAIEAAAAAEAAKRSESQAAASAAEQAALAANRAARADLIARLNRVLPTRETERGIVAEIAGVQFAVGKATLNTDAREALARFAGIVGVYPSMKFRVEGHTDSTGSAEFNRDLSFKRASTVRDFLVAQGVSNSSIDVEGLGLDRPVASNDTTEGRARNRRVEIILSGDPVAAP